LCKLDEILPEENYFEKSFLIDAHLISQKRSFSLRFLIDSDSVVYTIIHSNLVDKVCEELEIQPIPLAKEKLIRGYDGKISKKAIYLLFPTRFSEPSAHSASGATCPPVDRPPASNAY